MSLRMPVVSGQFYPEDKKSCLDMIEYCLRKTKDAVKIEDVKAIIVPHAGWIFSGPTAVRAFVSVEEAPDTVIMLGAVHRYGFNTPALYGKGSWKSPLGEVQIDEELSDIIEANLSDSVMVSPGAHNNEHSIEVNVPFVQYFFPSAKILPIACPPFEEIYKIGEELGDILKKQKKKILLLASSDLTHYGHSYGFTPQGAGPDAKKWVREVNDGSLIQYALDLESEKIVPYANESQSACGGGAIALLTAVVKKLGAVNSKLLEYTTSADSMPESMKMGRTQDNNFVAYASIAYWIGRKDL